MLPIPFPSVFEKKNSSLRTWSPEEENLPRLVNVDALRARGWGVGNAPENHTLDTPKWFGND
eukprot:1432928-Prorocentrum_lima.AAC.1